MTNPPYHALPLLEAFSDFFEDDVRKRCQHGEWLCWARRGSRDAQRTQVPIAAWPYIRIRGVNLLSHEEWRAERVKIRHAEINYGRPVFATEDRLCVVEKWFDPLFAPAGAVAPIRGHHERTVSKSTVDRWFRNEYAPSLGEQRPNRDKMVRDVRNKWGKDVPIKFVHELKSKYARGKAGRPQGKKSGPN